VFYCGFSSLAWLKTLQLLEQLCLRAYETLRRAHFDARRSAVLHHHGSEVNNDRRRPDAELQQRRRRGRRCGRDAAGGRPGFTTGAGMMSALMKSSGLRFEKAPNVTCAENFR
jgi:hypothetical protein